MLSLPTLLALGAWIPALIGMGTLVPIDLPDDVRLGTRGILGLGVLSIAAQWVGLVAPIGPGVSLALFAGGLAAFAFRARPLLADLRRAMVPLAGLLALAALQEPSGPYDAGLYYLQAIEWIRRGPPVFGLANLHGRFGFNSSWWIDAAALELPGMRGGSANFAAPLVAVLAAVTALGALRSIWRGDRSLGLVILAMLGLPAALALDATGGTAPDGVLGALVFAGLGLAALAIDAPRRDGLLVGALLLGSLAVTAKLSAAPVWLGAIAAAVECRRLGLRPRREAWTAIAWSAALLVPWAARGFATSGCWIYPVSATCHPRVAWAVPIADVQEMAGWIHTWSRWPGQQQAANAAEWSWVGPWLSLALRDRMAMSLTVAFAAGLALLAWTRTPPRRSGGIIAGTALLAISFWWMTAPSVRLGLPYLLLAAVVPFALAVRDAPGTVSVHPGRARWTAVAIVSLTVAFGYPAIRIHPAYTPSGLPPVTWGWPPSRAPDFRWEVSAHGARVRIPVGTDQCWDLPPPCAPRLHPGLRMEARRMVIAPP